MPAQSNQAIVNIHQVLAVIAAQRPLFHSEADFQHALAWEIHRQLPDASIRLEFPIRIERKSIHLDIWIGHPADNLAIELKYPTRGLSVRDRDENFALADQSAQDLHRYDFIKDIQRIEQIVSSRANTLGYAIFLTNDSSYWKRSASHQPVDMDFRMDEGRLLHGELKWGAGAGEGTTRGRQEPLTLRGDYVVHWTDYSQPCNEPYGKFRYILIEVCK